MRRGDLIDLLLLAAIWGGSFLFMRSAVPAFGPVPLIALRVSIASLVLLPWLGWRCGFAELRAHAGDLFVVGAINSALPFSLLAFATLSVTAGFASILNATAPMFGAVVAFVWLKERLALSRVVGLVVGFLGVLVLVWGRATLKPGGGALAVGAALLATCLYGIAANYTKVRLKEVNPLTTASGSQLGAALLLALPAAWLWPAQMPPLRAWAAVLALGFVCTALAYVLFFRLIAQVGATRAIAVTFLIPVFGMLWGGLFMGEHLTLNMVLGAGVILFGTGLATGVVQRSWAD